MGSNIPLSNAYSSVEYPDTVTAEFTAVTNNMTVEQSIKQLDTTIAQLVNEVIKDEKSYCCCNDETKYIVWFLMKMRHILHMNHQV